MQHGLFCIHCHQWCICNVIAKVREEEQSKDLDYAYVAAQAEADGQRDMLAKCIEVVRSMTIQFVGNSAATRDQVVDLLSALLVPATFVYTPACEFELCDSCTHATECTCECHRLRALEEKP
jgi:hypothetical protein